MVTTRQRQHSRHSIMDNLLQKGGNELWLHAKVVAKALMDGAQSMADL